MRLRIVLLGTTAVLSAPLAGGESGFRIVEHPFILWNADDLAGLRRRIQTEPWARAAWEAWMATEKNADRRRPHIPDLRDLARWAVLGDREAAEREKRKLLRVIESPIPRGGAQWITVLRYDLLYSELSADERRAFEDMARLYIRNAIFENAVFNPEIFNDSRDYSRYDAKKYTRTNWLPNTIWPRKVSANLMAAALRDEDLIRGTWSAYGSWKWYFDEYLCDIGFYAEEFSKMGSTPGAMLLYCRALRRLGLDGLGFAYRGRSGATMRGHIAGLVHLGYPRVDLHSSRPRYPMVTMGDLRQGGSSQGKDFPSPAFQHALVVGYLPDGNGGNVWWRAHGAWGGVVRGKHAQWDGYSGFTPKMQIPFWFEHGFTLWPDAGLDYFLAQMRGPDEERFQPSLLFGLEPIDPAQVEAPPAPSGVWPQRGLVMLRADESPSYWESPAPAVAMRLATPYAHSVNDSFALLGFHAFHRPLHVNRQPMPSYAAGWSRSIQSHCGVTVDATEPETTEDTETRTLFTRAFKYMTARTDKVYPGVSLSRSLLLTRRYLLDVTRLSGEKARDYTWILHTLGEVTGRDPADADVRPAELPGGIMELPETRSVAVGANTWSLTATQSLALEEPSEAELPAAWYERRVGVRLHMLGESGTSLFTARTPDPRERKRDREGVRRTVAVSSEVGGATVVVHRRGRETTFAAIHEPFENGRPRLAEYRRIAASAEGLAIALRAEGEDGSEEAGEERVVIAFDPDRSEPVTIGGSDERYTVSGAARIQVGRERVEVTGDLRAMELRVKGEPRLFVNGRQVGAAIESGRLRWKG